ncbi:Fc receptor-like protein 4 [Taeniopygia guttata]|uniref:Fc receptor-like protein 4 n=1 Tax=Taeniopygia guttata TaxID=59729 RepID=UPI003BB90CA2
MGTSRASHYQLVLQVPTQTLLEGDTVTLRCRYRQGNPVSSVFFYHEEKELEFQNGTELFLSHLQLHHSGRYRCRGWVNSRVAQGWEDSAPVTVTVHGEHPTAATPTAPQLFPRNWGSPAPPAPISCPEPFPVPVLEVPPESTEGSPLTLSCLSTPSPLRPRAPLLHVFYRDGQVVGVPQGSPQLMVPAVGVSHLGNYSCEVRSEGGAVQKSSAWLRITVRSECGDGHGEPPQTPWVPPWAPPCPPDTFLGSPHFCPMSPLTPLCSDPIPDIPLPTHTPVPIPPHQLPAPRCDLSPVCVPAVPVANATITLSPLAHQVRAGDPVTLRCSVQVGSAPVTFTWRHNGQEVAQGPLLELGDVNVGHSGTYQCVATNQLDSHQALSPELVLTVTSQGHMDPVVAGIGWALLFLVLLVGVIVAWHRWHRVAARKHQERPSPEPLATPEEGEILYTHVVSTKQAQRPSCITVPQERQVTYTELPGLHGRPCETRDINEIVL